VERTRVNHRFRKKRKQEIFSANTGQARSSLKRSNELICPDRQNQRTPPCIATASYVYDHAARELPKRLTREFHEHKDLAQATLHVHIDHESCLEVTVLRGRSAEVKAFADHVIAERGVRHRFATLSALFPVLRNGNTVFTCCGLTF
jgi:CopG family nickel-responsive transcriptional regulator